MCFFNFLLQEFFFSFISFRHKIEKKEPNKIFSSRFSTKSITEKRVKVELMFWNFLRKFYLKIQRKFSN